MTDKRAEFWEYDVAADASPLEVGGKARNLALCRQAGLDVPDGVILPVAACASFGEDEPSRSLCTAVSRRLSGAGQLVVRSSSVVEDSPERSWAGVFTSMVCRNEPAEILSACRACLASGDSPTARAYGGPAAMALLVQRLVPAVAAGVCFTPGTQDDDTEFLVNAVHGLGSVLTDDEAAADLYRVDLAPGTISCDVQGRQLEWRSPVSPRSLVALPQELAGHPVLDDRQAAMVAELAASAAAVLGCRADVEWVLAGKTLHLVQARPVTAGTDGADYTSWTRDNTADVIPGVVTPSTWSLLEPAVNRGFQGVLRRLRPGATPERLFTLIDSRAYFNMSAYTRLTTKRLGLTSVLNFGFGYSWSLFRHRLEAGRSESLFPARLESARTAEPAEALVELQRLLGHYMAVHVRTTILMDLGILLLRSLLGRWAGEREATRLTHRLLSGAGTLASCAPTDALGRLAAVIGHDDTLRQQVLDSPAVEVPQLLAGAGPAVSSRWACFLHDHGHCAMEEFELLHPRWREAPDFPARALQAHLASTSTYTSETGGKPPGTRRTKAKSRVRELLPTAAQPLVALLTSHLGRCGAFRESYKQLLVRIVDAVRITLLRMARAHAVSPTELIFFLTIGELLGMRDGTDMAALLETAGERQRQWRQAGELEPWAEIREHPDGSLTRIPRPARGGAVLRGTAQSGGYHTGTARVILDPGQVRQFDPGDVVVARATNPAWTPLLALAGAVVTDMGNYLSHSAIISRELGIPAVGNLHDATSRISDGQQVEVDGDQGLVRLPRDEQ